MNVVTKKIEIAAQLLAVAVPVIVASTMLQPEILILCYFTVGGVQVIFCLLNVFIGDKFITGRHSRKQYEKALAVTTLVFLPLPLVIYGEADILIGIYMCLLTALLFISPVLAVWYFRITLAELKDLEKDKRLVNDNYYSAL